jgi:hypothetical protein
MASIANCESLDNSTVFWRVPKVLQALQCESLDDIANTVFWRAPKVLQALQDVDRPVRFKNSDISNLQMLYYENIDWRHLS